MRTTLHPRLIIAALVACPLTLILAGPETEASRELKEMQEQRDRALAAAADPINRRFQQSLEQLLRRALQANDVDTAVKIRDVIATLPHEAAQQLAGQWRLLASTGYNSEVTLRADGTGSRTDGGKLQWHIEGTTLYLNPDPNADKFQLPVKDGKLKGVNSIGNGLTLTKK